MNLYRSIIRLCLAAFILGVLILVDIINLKPIFAFNRAVVTKALGYVPSFMQAPPQVEGYYDNYGDYYDYDYGAQTALPAPRIVHSHPSMQEASTTVLPVVSRATLNGRSGFIVIVGPGELEFVMGDSSTAVEEDEIAFLARTFNERSQRFEYTPVEVEE